MARPAKDTTADSTQIDLLKNVVNKVLKDFDEHNFNKFETPDYKVSSGSLNFDAKIGGGIGPSLVRMTGGAESGKTSATVSFLENFLKTVPDAYGVYIDAECRLHEKLKERTTVKFVTNPDEFVAGTCYVQQTTSYNMAIELMRSLVKSNMGNTKRFFFIVDSIDSLVPDDTVNINAEEVNQIAGMQKAGLTTKFLERFSAAMRKFGHIGVFISQIRTKVAPMYAKPDANFNITPASGAHKLIHDADWIFDFQSHMSNKYLITEGSGDNEKTVGHMCNIIIRKSQNDTTADKVSYPVRRNALPGKAIWKEREIFDRLIAYGKISKKGAWFTIDESVIKYLKDKQLDITTQFQGENSFVEFLEQNSVITEELYKYILDIMSTINADIE